MLGGLSMLGGFGVRLGLDTDSYARGMINAESLNRIFGQSVTAFLSSPLLGAFSAVQQLTGAFFRNASSIMGNVEALQRLSNTTGISTDTLQALQQRMDLTHGAGERVAGAMTAFARRLDRAKRSTGAAAASVREFGIDLTQFANTDDALRGVLDVINGFEDPARRAALAADFFGDEAGPILVNSIGGGTEAMAKMQEQAESLGRVIERDAIDSVANLNTIVGALGQAGDGLGTQAVATFLSSFADEVGGSEQSIVDLAGSLNERLIPVADNAGAAVGRLIGDLDELVDKINELFDRIADSPFADAFESNTSVASQLRDGSFWSTPAGSAFNFNPAVRAIRRSTEAAGDAAEWFFLGE